MAAPAGQNAARWIAIITVVLLLGVLWYVAPLVLPVYRWTDFDLAKIQAPEPTKQQFSFRLRYAPRGEGDPIPWQIISMSPGWDAVAEPEQSEDKVLVRINLVSDRTGQKPGELFVSANTYRDRYWLAKGWRLPPGSLGRTNKRPVVLIDMMTFEKMEMGDAQGTDFAIAEHPPETDDDWEDRMDGFRAKGAP